MVFACRVYVGNAMLDCNTEKNIACCTRQRQWKKNAIELHCWISYSREILNGTRVAVACNGTNRKLTIILPAPQLEYQYQEQIGTSYFTFVDSTKPLIRSVGIKD